MKSTVKKLSDNKVELTVTLDAKDLAPMKQAALEKLAKEVKVQGFRQGKVPVEVAAKFIPDNDLNSEVVDRAVRTTVLEAFRKSEKNPLVIPQVDVTKFVPDEMLEYTATADVVPEVKLGNFRKLGVKKPKTSVTDKDVDGVLENLANSYAEKKAEKKAVEKGDEAIIDFVGKRDGKPFEGGTAKDYPLMIGSGNFIPGFEDGIIGHEPGDKFDLDLTFPKDYGVKDLAGQKVVFEVLVKQVNAVKKPKIDDELAKKCGPFKSLAELKKDIKQNLTAQQEHQLMEKYKDDLITALVEKSKVTAPEVLVEDQLRMMREDVNQNAATQGVSFEEFLKQRGTSEKEWEEQARKVAEMRVKASLVMQTLAVEQKITVDEKEAEAKIAELREVYKKSPEALKSLKNPQVKNDIHNRLVLEKALDYLVKENS